MITNTTSKKMITNTTSKTVLMAPPPNPAPHNAKAMEDGNNQR